MAEKVIKKYILCGCKNPRTGATLTRPLITDRQTTTLASVVEFAVRNNYMTGQVENLTGTVKGFFEALKQYCLSGHDITLANWIRVHGELSGTVGESGLLDAARNAYKVRVGALSEFAVPLSTFSWERADGSTVKVNVVAVAAEAGTSPAGQIVKSKAFVVTGSNLFFNAAFGDKVEVSWKDEEGEVQSAALTPKTSGASAMTFDWPAALAEVETGTALTLKFTLHGGVKDALAVTRTKSVTLVA